jgi:chemotaxis protein methyltransferase CheR
MTIGASARTYLCDFIFRRSAIVIGADKDYLLEARLGPVARVEGCDSIDALADKMRRGPENGLHTKVVEAITTHETTFFRDLHPFEALRDEIFPALMRARAVTRTLTVFCAACSSGQEPYSISMILNDHFPDLATWNVRILATDLSAQVLERAREGKFHQIEVNRGLPAPMLIKHFERVGTDWQIKPAIKTRIDFRQLNLIEPWPSMPRIDVLFLRNVLIYFDIPAKQTIFARARQVLAPDAYMFLGGAETTLGIDASFAREQFGKATYYRPGGTRK